jgi:hypothetical protein
MIFLRKIFSKKHGMSLVEMTVAGALAGGAALGVASLMKSMGGSTKKAEAVIERTEFGSAMGVFLNSAKGCNSLKAGMVIPTAVTDYVSPDFSFDGFKNFQKNTDLRYNHVKYFTAEKTVIPDILPITLKDETGATKVLTKALIKFKLGVTSKSIERDPAKKAAEESKFPETRFEYNIPVMVNATGAVENCGDSSTMAEACFALKGVYNEQEDKCELPTTCESFGSFAVVNCSPKYASVSCNDFSRGTPYDNPVTGSKSCPAGASVISTGGQAWYKDIDCGKKCTARVNFSIGYYSCLKCD